MYCMSVQLCMPGSVWCDALLMCSVVLLLCVPPPSEYFKGSSVVGVVQVTAVLFCKTRRIPKQCISLGMIYGSCVSLHVSEELKGWGMARNTNANAVIWSCLSCLYVCIYVCVYICIGMWWCSSCSSGVVLGSLTGGLRSTCVGWFWVGVGVCGCGGGREGIIAHIGVKEVWCISTFTFSFLSTSLFVT